MLLNLSNHPVESWSVNQIAEANKHFGEVLDLPFPPIDPFADENEIDRLTDKYLSICMEKLNNSNDEMNAVHLMGELTFTLNLVCKLLKQNIVCVASTTERKIYEEGGKKISEFNFVKFREYKLPSEEK